MIFNDVGEAINVIANDLHEYASSVNAYVMFDKKFGYFPVLLMKSPEDNRPLTQKLITEDAERSGQKLVALFALIR
jgi:hypothetical protein